MKTLMERIPELLSTTEGNSAPFIAVGVGVVDYMTGFSGQPLLSTAVAFIAAHILIDMKHYQRKPTKTQSMVETEDIPFIRGTETNRLPYDMHRLGAVTFY